MIYKAKLKEVSEVDGNGMVDIYFQVSIDDVVKYPSIKAHCIPQEAEDAMEKVLQGIKASIEYVEEMPDNLEVTI